MYVCSDVDVEYHVQFVDHAFSNVLFVFCCYGTGGTPIAIGQRDLTHMQTLSGYWGQVVIDVKEIACSESNYSHC